jgi:hypothetical protein
MHGFTVLIFDIFTILEIVFGDFPSSAAASL